MIYMSNASDLLSNLDEPFVELVEAEEVEIHESCYVKHPTLSPPAACTPGGFELIFGNECEEPTRIYPPGWLDGLLQHADPNKHPTLELVIQPEEDD
jgi:hypothetical protein